MTLPEDPEKIAKRRTKTLLGIILFILVTALFSTNYEDGSEQEASTNSADSVSERDQLRSKLEDVDHDNETKRVKLLMDIAGTPSATARDTEEALAAVKAYVDERKWPDLDEKLELLKDIQSVASAEWLNAEVEEVEFFLRAESDCRSAVRDDILSSIQNPSTYEYNYAQRFWVNDIYAIVTEFSAKNAFGLRQEFISRHACEPDPETETYTVTKVSVVQEPHRF